ncbi:MAG: hypothetical protein GEU71_19130 [Actinobacteria bacterium]|nr:hypothetical protein [Actinomycetota bacterium]
MNGSVPEWGALQDAIAGEVVLPASPDYDPHDTAFVHRDELFLLKQAVVIAPDTGTTGREPARRWLTKSWETTRRWGSEGVYPNFPDPDLEDWGHACYGANYDRLVQVKAKYDPDNFFRFEQSIPGEESLVVA